MWDTAKTVGCNSVMSVTFLQWLVISSFFLYRKVDSGWCEHHSIFISPLHGCWYEGVSSDNFALILFLLRCDLYGQEETGGCLGTVSHFDWLPDWGYTVRAFSISPFLYQKTAFPVTQLAEAVLLYLASYYRPQLWHHWGPIIGSVRVLVNASLPCQCLSYGGSCCGVLEL